MKGIILAGGEGTRLNPCTLVVGKQLLPVYDKPMIYYPLSTLIHAGVDEVLIISTPQETPKFEKLLGDGSRFGISIQYKVQSNPEGIPQGIILGKQFLGESDFWFILGDNLFHGPDFGAKLSEMKFISGALIFAYRVQDPSPHGIVTFDESNKKILHLKEKPVQSLSRWAIPGLYKLDSRAVTFAETLKPSTRGELEILDLMNVYLREEQLICKQISRGNSWLDLGTANQLLKASLYVQMVQERQGLLIGSPEEAAINSHFLSAEDLKNRISTHKDEYSKNLLRSLSLDD
jgi:glucose-1-phosphate thymidylyltransferase